VRSVGRDEQVGPDGRPRRQVVVAGQDCGAAFLMEMVSAWITFQNDGLAGPLPASLTWLRELGLDSRAIKVEDFMWQTATVATQSIMDAVGYQFQQKFYVNKGTVVPYSAFSQEGTIWEMLYRHTDPPWNEFFVRENRNMFPDMSVRCPGSAGDIHKKELLDPELVFRPTPWLDYDENPLPDVNMDSVTMWNIAMKNVVALRAHRDDSELVNHVQIKPTLLGGTGYTQVFQPDMGLVNADTRAKYGDRIQNDVTQLFPADLARPPINLPRADQLQAENVTKDWVTERRDWMVLAQNRIHDFERGSITMKGYPMMRVGDYFRLHRGDIIWHGYVTNIVHDYQPYRHYFTTMDYIRGSQIKVRREIQNPWDVERKTGT
jgi:hypothetical protein